MSVASTNARNLPESSLSIPVYEGSMLSIRSNSRVLTGGVPYKSGNGPDPYQDIKWKFGKLDKKYECNYCMSYLKCPYKLQECGHRVCSTCLIDLMKKNPSCPTCDRPVSRERAVIDNELQREILNLPIYCSYNLNGCKWEGMLKSLQIHVDECEYALVDCPRGCGLKYQKRAESKHLASDCLKNQSTCEFCADKISKQDEVTHLVQCRKFPIPCPSKCGIKEIPREKMENHLENECSKHEINCPFGECGCTHKSLRSEMPKHLKDAPGIHLNLMCKTLVSQKKQMQLLTDIIEKQKSQLQGLVNKTETLNKFYGSQLIWKIDGYAEKYQECKTGKKPTIFSPPFLTSRHGYKLALSASLFGDGKAKGKYMSIFLCICKGEFDALLSWPFSHKITFTLLDQCEMIETRRPVSYTIKPNTCKENAPFLDRPTGERNASFGAQKFFELEALNAYDYVLNDTMFIKVEIDSENMILV